MSASLHAVQQGLKDRYFQLLDDISRLTLFMNTAEFTELDPTETALIDTQLIAMRKLLEALRARLVHWGIK